MTKRWIVEIICILFIFLFVYTAVSKFIDYRNFRAIIGQSPLITKLSGPLSFIVPLIEIVISVMLCLPKFRRWGLMSSFILMILFTSYIVMLVTFSPHVPCSCGGVISAMSWQQHIIFNLVFVILALVGLYYHDKPENKFNKKILTKA